jgi:hypothetical protein
MGISKKIAIVVVLAFVFMLAGSFFLDLALGTVSAASNIYYGRDGSGGPDGNYGTGSGGGGGNYGSPSCGGGSSSTPYGGSTPN